MTKKDETSYGSLRNQLDEIISWFNQDDLNVDEAVEKYAEANKIAKQLRQHLEKAENTIKKISE